MTVKRILVAGAFVAATAAAANAADLPTPPIAPPPPPPMATPAFDWSGLYFGLYGGGLYNGSFLPRGGVQAGYNFVPGRVLVGVEAQAGIFYNGVIEYEADLNGRLGFILGERFLVYGEGGITYLTTDPLLWNAGGGIAVGLGRSASIFAEAKAIGAFGGGAAAYFFEAGVNFHR